MNWPPQSQPPWKPPAPPQKNSPSWLLPVAIVVAAILITGGAIVVALITTNRESPKGTSPSVTAMAPSSSTSDADSSTCRAWRSTRAALDNASDPLPDGWNWTTPGIDALIAQSNAIITNALNLFEPQIAAQPADVAAAAHAYITARRNEVARFTNHTYTEADGVPVNSASATLNQLCHMTG
jgi:cytoskeletal protein RodZ